MMTDKEQIRAGRLHGATGEERDLFLALWPEQGEPTIKRKDYHRSLKRYHALYLARLAREMRTRHAAAFAALSESDQHAIAARLVDYYKKKHRIILSVMLEREDKSTFPFAWQWSRRSTVGCSFDRSTERALALAWTLTALRAGYAVTTHSAQQHYGTYGPDFQREGGYRLDQD